MSVVEKRFCGELPATSQPNTQWWRARWSLAADVTLLHDWSSIMQTHAQSAGPLRVTWGRGETTGVVFVSRLESCRDWLVISVNLWLIWWAAGAGDPQQFVAQCQKHSTRPLDGVRSGIYSIQHMYMYMHSYVQQTENLNTKHLAKTLLVFIQFSLCDVGGRRLFDETSTGDNVNSIIVKSHDVFDSFRICIRLPDKKKTLGLNVLPHWSKT